MLEYESVRESQRGRTIRDNVRDERVARQVLAELTNLVSADVHALECARPNEIGEGARELIVGGSQHAQVRERGERFERTQRVAIEVGLLHVCARLDGGNVGQVLVLEGGVRVRH